MTRADLEALKPGDKCLCKIASEAFPVTFIQAVPITDDAYYPHCMASLVVEYNPGQHSRDLFPEDPSYWSDRPALRFIVDRNALIALTR